jgi:hypothetical protein
LNLDKCSRIQFAPDRIYEKSDFTFCPILLSPAPGFPAWLVDPGLLIREQPVHRGKDPQDLSLYPIHP